MAQMAKPCCKTCKKYGIKMYLKGRRCESDRCAMDPRKARRARRTSRRMKLSEYAMQVREKNKLRIYYGVGEAQFRRYFEIARRTRGVTGTVLLQLLERRLDNVVYRLNWTFSRRMARQAVVHGHIFLNGRKMDRPGYTVKLNDVVSLKPNDSFAAAARACREERKNTAIPAWMQPSDDGTSAVITRFPTREEISIPVEEQHIINLYSK